MRFMFLLTALSIGLAPTAAAAQTMPAAPVNPAQAEGFWTVSEERLSFTPAKVSVPRRVAGAEYFETKEFSHKDEGVDTAVLYRSADQKVFATLYVYYPSIAHSGVQALATDQAIRAGSRPPTVRSLGTALASAGGKPKVAVTADYDHYRGDLATKSAFIKAGRWMLKLRVVGPEARSAEVASIMTALLDGLRFEGEVQPRLAEPITARECTTTARPDAKPMAGGDAAADAALAALDPAGQPTTKTPRGNQKPPPARIGRDWCRTTMKIADNQVTVLEAIGKGRSADGAGGNSALLILIGDSAGVIEAVRLDKGKRYLLLHHSVASVNVLDNYDALPSLAQIGRLFGSPLQARARVRLTPTGGTEVGIPDTHEEAED